MINAQTARLVRSNKARVSSIVNLSEDDVAEVIAMAVANGSKDYYDIHPGCVENVQIRLESEGYTVVHIGSNVIQVSV